MKEFTIFWLNGTTEKVTGETIESAFAAAGYGAGATSAIDFFSGVPGVENDYVWNKDERSWNKKDQLELDA